jgi:hypothetical protein
MEIAENRTQLGRRSRTNRAKITNGTALFNPATVDGRSQPARRFHDVLHQILADLGGADRLSEGQRQLCRRAATMSLTCELMEAEAVAGRAFDVDCFGQLTDRLGRCFQRLGLERKTRDVTPSLQDYLEAKVEHAE